jgi:adenylate cyclase
MNLFSELKRRNVFRVGIAYALAAWLVMQFADVVLNNITAPEWVFKAIMLLLAIGFPFTLIIAWAFEMTPEGIKREKDVDRSQSIAPKTGKNLDRMIIVGMALIIVGMGVERFWFASRDEPANTQTVAETQPPPEESKPPTIVEALVNQRESVAVLPFTSMSSGEDDSYFADGLTEEILNSLARLPELLVTARTSSFHFKGKNIPVPEIAATLGVAHVVEGSVRRSGEQVRITAQLIRAEDGFHLWSQTYDRTLEDVFAVQEDIAENIAETLDVVLNEDKRQKMHSSGIKDVEAFIAYQKGMEAFDRAHDTGNPVDLLPEANRWFDQVLAISPNISTVFHQRTDLYGHIIYDHTRNLHPASQAELEHAYKEIQTGLTRAMQTAESAAERAIIDAERIIFSNDWTGLTTRLDQAFVPGDCTAVNWTGESVVVFGWAKPLVEQVRDQLRCDPLSLIPAYQLPRWEVVNGNPQAGVEAAEHYLQIQGFRPWIDDGRFIALLATGDYHDDPHMADDNPEGSGYAFPRKILMYAMENDISMAQQVLDDWLANGTVDDDSLLSIHAAMGNRDEANKVASRIDTRFGGPYMLTFTINACMCGAPFDLDATPNFRKRIEEAGFNWPPISPLNYPAKDW